MHPESTVAVSEVGAHWQNLCSRRTALKALAAWGSMPLLAGGASASHEPLAGSAADETNAPYRLAFTGSVADLIGDLEQTERGDPLREAKLPHSEWYSRETRRRCGTWGPEPRSYAPLANLSAASVEWQRERVVATAARFLGYGYQYHHIPDWDPPASWPWSETSVGHNGKGVDCSNLTSFVFNQGFGIRFSSAIRVQAERDHAIEKPRRTIAIRRIELPKGYEQRQKTLCTGDLVYIRGRVDGPISHVVIWVGSVGRSASGVPLVLDSHGPTVKDDAGRTIPCGVQLRPFRKDSWYNRCASHAHRIFGNNA